ncbi:hypothetical protein D4M78_17995 [Klebsiella variicola]|nr:hypothetical protein DQB70_15440 [Klebsiella variicola]KAA1715394.1 hypothetical protein F1D85_12060 [Klebsiella variicola]MBZ6538342.1 hypothetical protein [Klebsiella variicola]MBZ7327939.1 hypothetical protein [Klebsiella variicola]OSZ07347.1 hypothetical protein BVZ23_26180 [Klebsiella variicola]
MRYAKARFFAFYCPVSRANSFIKKRFRPGSRCTPHLTLKRSEIKFFPFCRSQCVFLRFILPPIAVLCCLLR